MFKSNLVNRIEALEALMSNSRGMINEPLKAVLMKSLRENYRDLFDMISTEGDNKIRCHLDGVDATIIFDLRGTTANATLEVPMRSVNTDGTYENFDRGMTKLIDDVIDLAKHV